MNRILSTKDIGAAIRRERKRQGYTQVQLSELTGIGVSYIGNIERGKETAEIGKALDLLTLLGIDIFVQKRGE
jgi:y4mF family transcriptional regulator